MDVKQLELICEELRDITASTVLPPLSNGQIYTLHQATWVLDDIYAVLKNAPDTSLAQVLRSVEL